MRRLTAGVLALSGFMVAILSGMNAGNPTGSVLITSIVCMVVCHIAGSILGLVLENVLNEHRASLATPETSELPIKMGIEIGGMSNVEQPDAEQQPEVSRAAA